MSCYFDYAIHPVTKQIESALWIDDYFGRHRYGVKFSDGRIYRAEEITQCDPPPATAQEGTE